MATHFYNTLSRKKEEFLALEEGKEGIYCCGPTVYNFVHIGNLRAAAFNDLIRRYFLFKGYEVKQVINITDFDDKVIKALKDSDQTLEEYTSFYAEKYMEDLATLGFQVPEMMPRASQEVEKMVEIIQLLLERGHAYKNDAGDVYFRISSFERYGDLAQLDMENLLENAAGRLSTEQEYGKDDASDFALWKAYREEDGKVFWETALGKGRPGWHVECSAMSSKYLGQPFDIHCGGIDLIFPHHTNEVAQSECAYGCTFANYWMHNGFLQVDGKKMSKSLNNFYTLRDLLKLGHKPAALRFELIRSHYRAQLDFRASDLSESNAVVDKFYEFFSMLKGAHKGSGWESAKKASEQVLQDFESALDDDLNIAQALSATFAYMTEVNKNRDSLSESNALLVLETVRKLDSVIGLEALIFADDAEELPAELLELAEQRKTARAEKKYEEADRIRDRIAELGYEIKDTPEGITWKRL